MTHSIIVNYSVLSDRPHLSSADHDGISWYYNNITRYLSFNKRLSYMNLYVITSVKLSA